MSALKTQIYTYILGTTAYLPVPSSFFSLIISCFFQPAPSCIRHIFHQHISRGKKVLLPLHSLHFYFFLLLLCHSLLKMHYTVFKYRFYASFFFLNLAKFVCKKTLYACVCMYMVKWPLSRQRETST